MIILKNLNQLKSLPAIFTSEDEFIDYTIDEALWQSLNTNEVTTMKKWGFSQIIDEQINGEDIYHWKADLNTCLNFWLTLTTDNWQVSFQ